MMYKLYAGNAEQFVYSLNTDNLKIAIRRVKAILYISHRRVLKEETPNGYPLGANHYSYVWFKSLKPKRVVRRKFMLLKEHTL